MTRDLSRLTDQELLRLAGQQSAPQINTSSQDLSRLSDQELLALSNQQPQEQSFLGKVGEAVLEIGPGLGELAAGAFQRGAELVGREDISKKVGEQVSREREGLTTSQKIGRAAGQVIPFLPAGVATGTATAARLGGGALAKVAGAGTAGAVGGAEVAALTPTEEGTREAALGQIAQGAGLGALGGSVIAGAGQVIRGTGRSLKRAATATKPEDILAKRLPSEQTADLLKQLKTATPDSPILLPDIAGDEVKGLTRSIGKISGAKDIVTDVLEGRSKQSVERVSNQLSRDISNIDSYFGSLDDIAKARSEIAAPLYKKAFDKGTTLNISKNRDLFDKIAPDLKDARRSFRLGDEIPDNSIVMLDAAKKSLDDKIGSAIRSGERQQARALQGIKSELVDKIDELNPDYKKARQVFSDFSSIENAQQQGLQFTKLRPEELKRTFNGFTTSEKEAFRVGVRESLQKTVSSTSEGADPAKRIFGNSFKRKQLEAVFPSETKFKEFEKRMIEEIKAAETKFKVLGGSRTDINLADEEQVLSTIAKGGAILSGGKIPVISAAVSSVKNRFGGISDKNARQIANILVKRDKSIAALENILKKQKSQTQKRLVNDFINFIRPELIITQTTIQE